MPCLALSALIPAMKPGRVTRTAIVLGSWQSRHATECWTSGWPLSSFISRASLVRHGRDQLEAFLDVALAGEAIERQVRGVALDARAGLLLLGHAPGRFLIEQRVEVAASVAVVERERVAGEDPLEPGVTLELLLGRARVARPQAAASVLGRGGQRRAQI